MSRITPLLQCRALNAGYGASRVLFDVQFNVMPGSATTLLGRNGMGKSTTIKVLLGLVSLREGEVLFDGKRIDGLPTDAIARHGIAIVPEGRQCFPNLTVAEHLYAFASNRNGLRDEWTPERIYELFPRLKERSRNLGNQLSGGEQQMLAIGRALSTNPRLLVLDEATEGLAPVIREEIWRCLSLLKSTGQTILVVDKYVDKLVGFADQHLILERGQVVWRGGSNDLLADRSLWSRYLGV